MPAARVLRFALVIAAAALMPGAAHAQRSCPAPRASCFTVTVPLDRSGVVPGTVMLRVARVRGRRRSLPPVIGLTGGPGQAGVTYAETYQLIIPSGGRDLVLFDQRGTGASGLLRCPGFERRLDTAFSVSAGSCGRSLGSRRSFYRSPDSADDLEAVRVRIGADRVALYAVSYGTRVALEYARRYPARVERMILDSPIGIDAPDPLARETLAAIARVIRAACRGGCGGAEAHPVADIARLRQRLRRSPIRRIVRRDSGGRVRVRFDADDLLALIVTGDLDPDLMRAVPPAVRQALRGHSGALARLKIVANDGQEGGRVSEFSPALFAATTCEESPLAWDPAADLATRRAQARATLDATPASRLLPFDRAAAIEAGLLPLCGDWPAPERPVVAPPALPTLTPTLILSGELDLRTPLENARSLQSALHARLLIERDTGHGVLGSDPFGCAGPASEAFLARRKLPRCRRPSGVRIEATAARTARSRSRPPAVR